MNDSLGILEGRLRRALNNWSDYSVPSREIIKLGGGSSRGEHSDCMNKNALDQLEAENAWMRHCTKIEAINARIVNERFVEKPRKSLSQLSREYGYSIDDIIKMTDDAIVLVAGFWYVEELKHEGDL